MCAILFELLGFGGWELILILSVLLILSGERWPRLRDRFLQGLREFINSLRHGLKQWECIAGEQGCTSRIKPSLVLYLAQGFGIGRIPFAPGTFGSIAGILWFCDLLFWVKGNFWCFLGGCMVGIGLSVYVCGAAEKILKQTDPSSIVLDEIVSMPLCFAGWVGIIYFRNDPILTPMHLFSSLSWELMLCIFALFRFFDILKPWPVGRSQALPGGWGVTLDDVLAALYVNLATLAVFGGYALFAGNS